MLGFSYILAYDTSTFKFKFLYLTKKGLKVDNLAITPFEKEQLQNADPLVWINKAYQDKTAVCNTPSIDELYTANTHLMRFAPLLATLFPELKASNGIIESRLIKVDSLNQKINSIGGSLFLKADHNLPIAGSIKARGGIYEVLHFAHSLAKEHKLLSTEEDNYSMLSQKKAQALFSKHTIIVGSTGNLGLSIGIIGDALGFNTIVHMSCEAKEWKKDRLRQCGVTVIEHDDDYSAAVAAGRINAANNPLCYFIDDERSPYLFAGYAVAALRLQTQLKAANIQVDKEHPLFVYLPAGVGGAPGGITFGLKHLFGEYVHCFFAEPVQAPCMLLGMAGSTGSVTTCVSDCGLTIDTDADGLAVGQASQWVCDATRHLLSGVYTATDEQIYKQLYLLKACENIEVEPSAAISCLGPSMLNTPAAKKYLTTHGLLANMGNSTHIAWLTGGSLVPKAEYQHYLEVAQQFK